MTRAKYRRAHWVRPAVDHADAGFVLHRNCNRNCNRNCALKEEKPDVALSRILSLLVASATQVTRHHDLLTRFLMITFNVPSMTPLKKGRRNSRFLRK